MVKLICNVKSIEKLALYQADGLVFSYKDFSLQNESCFNIAQIKKIVSYCKKNNKLSILSIDKIFEEEELDKVKEFIDKARKLEIDFYIYSDFAIQSYFSTLKEENKLIYAPKTLISSKEEALYYKEKKELVVIANELCLSEIIEVSKARNTIVEAFGYHQMFYSRRELLQKYQKFIKTSEKLDNRKLFLKEELRDNLYLIIENKKGTFIYTDYIYFLFDELKEIKDEFTMIKLNGDFIEEEKFIKVVNTYQKALKEDIFEKEVISDLFDNLGRGFLDNKSFLLKESNDE